MYCIYVVTLKNSAWLCMDIWTVPCFLLGNTGVGVGVAGSAAATAAALVAQSCLECVAGANTGPMCMRL